MFSAAQKWLVTFNPQPNPRMRLFCFPYSGGASHIYSKWPDRLPKDIEVVAIQPPGRSNRFTEPLISNWEPMVNGVLGAIRDRLDRPFALFGHSMGGMIAYEVCRQLESEGIIANLLMPSGRNAPHIKSKMAPLHQLNEVDFTHEIKTFNGTPSEVLENPELMELMVPILRADFTISETYQHQPGPILKVPIRAFGGTSDPHVTPEGVSGWQEYTQAKFEATMLDGDHFFLHGEAREFFQVISQYLSANHQLEFEEGTI